MSRGRRWGGYRRRKGWKSVGIRAFFERMGKRVVVLAVEGEVLAVPESAAGKECGKIRGDVGVGVAEIRSVQNHRAIEQRVGFFLDAVEFREEIVEQLHVPLVNGLELG